MTGKDTYPVQAIRDSTSAGEGAARARMARKAEVKAKRENRIVFEIGRFN